METDLPDCHEGPEAYERFDATMSALLSVPKKTVVRRQKAWRKKVDAVSKIGAARSARAKFRTRRSSTTKTAHLPSGPSVLCT